MLIEQILEQTIIEQIFEQIIRRPPCGATRLLRQWLVATRL